MNIRTQSPFKSAKIEIYDLCDLDIIVTSPLSLGSDPFEGEEDEF